MEPGALGSLGELGALGATAVVLALTSSAAFAAPPSPTLSALQAEVLEEDPPHAADISLGLRYERAVAGSGPLENLGMFSTRMRAYLGSTVAYCAGLDLDLGAADTGFLYRFDARLLGIAARFGGSGAVALCGGVGVSGVTGGVDVAAEFPLEFHVSVNAGPVRLQGWFDMVWTAGQASRSQDSVSIPGVHEFNAGIAVRIGGDRRYWADVHAGGGVALGVVYREWAGSQFVGAFVGLGLSGGR